MDKIKFLDLTGLQQYDASIKEFIDTKNADSLSSAKSYTDTQIEAIENTISGKAEENHEHNWEDIVNAPDFVKTINNVAPNENGNVNIDIPEIDYPVTSVNGQTGAVTVDWESLPDKPFGEDVQVVEILPNTSVEIYDRSGGWGDYYAPVTLTKQLVVGQTYVIVLDDVSYEAVAVNSFSDLPIINFGDGFALLNDNASNLLSAQLARNQNGSHTIAVFERSTIINVIDEKYIPNTIARTSDIPEDYVETVNGIAPDENGNVNVGWNDLTDKPFGTGEVTLLPRQWYEVPASGLEVTLTQPIVDGNVYYTYGEHPRDGGDERNAYVASLTSQGYYNFISFGGGYNADLTPIEGSKYLLEVSGAPNTFMFEITCKNGVIPLDDKFIPDTIARVEDVPNIPTDYVKSVNGVVPDEDGNVTIELPDIESVDLTGYVKSVNGTTPDESGNVVIDIDSADSSGIYVGDEEPETSEDGDLWLDTDEDAGSISALPEITTADEGKVIQVVNGEYKLVEATLFTEEDIYAMLVKWDAAPAIVDADGKIITDENGYVLVP